VILQQFQSLFTSFTKHACLGLIYMQYSSLIKPMVNKPEIVWFRITPFIHVIKKKVLLNSKSCLIKQFANTFA